MIKACGRQVRASFGAAYALDFPAFFQMAAAMGAPTMLLAELLPEIEPIILDAYRKEEGE